MKLTAIVASLLAASVISAAARAEQPAAVANVKVVSDKVPDVSSLEAWKKSTIKDSMTDKEKCMAVWKTIATFQHQDAPPAEFVHNEGPLADAVKMMNVYGYSFCGVAANEMASLARYSGLQTRIRTINAHVVPELFWDNKWHLLDASLINYFNNPDGDVASIDDIMKAVQDWLKEHPELKGNDAALRKFQQQNGWQGWKNGPALLASGPLFDANGWHPAHTHGWYSTMQEYDGKANFPHEAGYSMGYKVNITLRPGEKLTRNWSNKGLYINMDGTAGKPGCMNMEVGKGNLAYAAKLFGDIAPGRVGNGTLEYIVPLTGGSLPLNALKYVNLDEVNGSLAIKDKAKQGVLEIRNPTSYVYLMGEATVNARVGNAGKLTVLYSDNNGLDWKDLAVFDKSGEQKIDLSKLIIRKYDYRVKFIFDGDTALTALKFTHDVQHSQRALPALAQGENTLTFSAGPQEGTITIEGATNAETCKGRNLMYTDFRPVTENIAADKIVIQGEKGSITQDIATPGDMTRMNILTHYRARGKNSGWDVQVSFDAGNTWKSVTKAWGPTAFNGNYVEIKDIPSGTKAAKVRWLGEGGSNGVMIFNMRVDADYKLPGAGFRPVKITYLWDEAGESKKDEHIARQENETWKIKCETTPKMKSIIMELAQ